MPNIPKQIDHREAKSAHAPFSSAIARVWRGSADSSGDECRDVRIQVPQVPQVPRGASGASGACCVLCVFCG